MNETLGYEPSLRKNWLISLLNKLADPEIELSVLKQIAQSDALPYVWRWQDDIEGHFYKEKTAVTEPLKQASANLITLLMTLVERNGLPKVEEPKQVVPAEAIPPRFTSQSTDSHQPAVESNTDHNDEGSSKIEKSDGDESDSASDTSSVSEHSSSSYYASHVEKHNDRDMHMDEYFQPISEEDAEFSVAALAFLFHAADGAGGAMYNLEEAVDFTSLGRVTCSLLYATNIEVSMAAARVLGQVIGASRYCPTPNILLLLLSMALNVPCSNGSSAKANTVTMSSFIKADCALEDVLNMLDDSITPCCRQARLRVAEAFPSARKRDLLVAQQAYSIATIIVLIGEHGYEKLVMLRAPNVLPALVALCRDSNPETCASAFLKSCIVESLTIFLSFLGHTHNMRLFRRLQLSPLLSEFHSEHIDEQLFYQLCDLASFAPNQNMVSPQKLVQLSVSHELSSEAKLRALDVLARLIDPPPLQRPMPDQHIESFYTMLYTSFSEDLDRLVAQLEKPAARNTLTVGYIHVPHDPQRYFQLVTERLDVLGGFVVGLTWTYKERTVLKSDFINRLVFILTDQRLLDSMPTRALCLAAETIAAICNTEQARVLLLNEQKLMERLYDAIIFLSRTQSRSLDLFQVIKVLHKCLWGNAGRSLPELFETEGEQTEALDDAFNSSGFRYVSSAGGQEDDGPPPNIIVNHRLRDNTSDSDGEEDSEYKLSEFEIALLKMATSATVESFCNHMPQLMRDYTNSAAKDCSSCLSAIVKTAQKHTGPQASWIYKLLKTYVVTMDALKDVTPALELEDFFKKLLSFDLMTTKIGALILRFKIFSTRPKRFLGYHPHLAADQLDNLIRSVVEITIDEGSPLYFLRMFHAICVSCENEEKDESWHFYKIVPYDIVKHFLAKFMNEAPIAYRDDLSLLSHIRSKLPKKVVAELISEQLGLKGEHTLASTDEYLAQRVQGIFAFIKYGESQQVKDEFTAWALEKFKSVLREVDNPLQVALYDVLRDFRMSSYSSTSPAIKSAFEEVRSMLISEKGIEAWASYPDLLSYENIIDVLVSEWNRDKLESAVKGSSEQLLECIHTMWYEIVSSKSSLLITFLQHSLHCGTCGDDSDQADDRDVWLEMASFLTVKLAGHSSFERSSSFYALLVESAVNLLKVIGSGELLIPQAFSTLHALILNALNVGAMIDLGPGSVLLKDDGRSRQVPSSFSGLLHGLLDHHKCSPEDLKKFVSAAKDALLGFADEYRHEDQNALEKSYELGVLGLNFSVAMVVQLDVEVAKFAIENEFIPAFMSAAGNFSESLQSVAKESLVGIAHVMLATPAVMAAMLAEKAVAYEAISIDDDQARTAAYEPIEAILIRRPELSRVVTDSFQLTSSGKAIPWKMVEKSAKAQGVADVARPESLNFSIYPSLASGVLKVLIDNLANSLLDAEVPFHAEVACRILIDLLNLTGKTRHLLLSGERKHKFVQRVLIQFGIQNVPDSPRCPIKPHAPDVIPLIAPLMRALTRKSKDEAYSGSTRRQLESSTKIVMRSLCNVLENEVSARCRKGNNDLKQRGQAIALLTTCTDIIQAVWGDSEQLLEDLAFIKEDVMSGSSPESRGKVDTADLYYHSIMREMKVIEILAATFSLFDFSWNELYELKICTLHFLNKLVYQELFKIHIDRSQGRGSNKRPHDRIKDDEELDNVDVEDYDSDGSDFYSDVAGGSGSNEEDEMIENDIAEERRLQHRQRIDSARSNSFRNSSLGEYESSIDSMEDDQDESDGMDETGEEFGSDLAEMIIDPEQLSAGHDTGMDFEGSSGDNNGSRSEGEHELEIMLVLSGSEDGNDGEHRQRGNSFSGSESGRPESISESASAYESGPESDSSISSDDSDTIERFDIVLNEGDGHRHTYSIEPERTHDHSNGFLALGDPALEVEDEVLLLYSERENEERDWDFLPSPHTRYEYLRSVFNISDPEEYKRDAQDYVIDEDSSDIWDRLQIPMEEKSIVRKMANVDGWIARANVNKHLDSALGKLREPKVEFVLKTGEDANSSFLSAVLAMFARVFFSEGFDIENNLILHTVVVLAGVPVGRQLFTTLINILFEVSCGHIDNVYGTLTRIAASASPNPLPNSELSSSIPVNTTPALVCHNILTILNMFFGAEIIRDDPGFLWNCEANRALCDYDDCESDYLNTISSMANDYMKNLSASFLGLVTKPVISQNKALLELASGFVKKMVLATSDKWDPSKPDDQQSYEDLNDETTPGSGTSHENSGNSGNDEESDDAKDETDIHDDGNIIMEVDETTAMKLIDVLSSKQCSYRVFTNIVDVIRKNTDANMFNGPLIKEIRKAKHFLLTGFKRVLESQNSDKVYDALLRFLRLLNVVGSLYSDKTCLTTLFRVDLVPLWNRVLRVIEVLQLKEGVMPEFMLALLETVAMPAEIIYRENDAIEQGLIENDAKGDVKPDTELNGFDNFIPEVTTCLQECMPRYGKVINELIRAKPNLLSGPLGAMALRFKVVDFNNKCDWLSQEVAQYRDEKYAGMKRTCEIRREYVFEDSFNFLSKLRGPELLYPLEIKFAGEEGVDEGGVAREWYEILSREILNPMYGLFCPTVAGSSIYQVNQLAEGQPDKEEIFRFVGRLVGRAVYDQYTVGLYFNRAIYKFFLNDGISLSDMESVDESYYKSLRWMLDNDITDVFFETFSVEIDNFGEPKVVDLIPNGRNVAVDESNKQEYVRLIVEYKLVNSVRGALEAMKKGLHEVLFESWIQTFTDQELELLMSGLPTIDVDDWYENTEYEGYNAASRQVRWFWLAVKSFNSEMRAKLLQFSTGTSRVPAQGFGHLESNTDSGKFFIHREKGNTDRLPSAHTCMNQISLPEYESYGKLRRLLLKAITEGNEGFGFV